MATLIKIDRNGSKHFEGMITCDRCQGRGWFATHVCNGQLVPSKIDQAVCWKCHGEGKVYGKWIERTPEYQAKLEAKRKAKQEARMAEETAKQEEQKAHADEANAAFFQKQGFNAEGKTYVILGDTYKIKDELKQLGCKFSNIFGWHIDHQIEGYDLLMVDVNECFDKDYTGTYRWNLWKNDGLTERIHEASLKAAASRSKSQHVGSIGDRISTKATLTKISWYDTNFGTKYIYTFTDIWNNVLVWKTTGGCEKEVNGLLKPVEAGEMITITGTVKSHDEYQGIKQTVLTRCKIQWPA